MKSTWWRSLYGAFGIAFSALTLIAASSLSLGVASAADFGTHEPIVWTASGPIQGAAGPGGYQFLGLPYAAPPTGQLRWRPPQPVANWRGVRDATQFAPSCPQPPSLFAPIGPTSEDCLHLNVYTPALGGSFRTARPVLVWLHGGGFVLDGARSYDPSNLAAKAP
jgi:para-nitrobenzyl esterase